jgi:polysaccharide transporter, PST family
MISTDPEAPDVPAAEAIATEGLFARLRNDAAVQAVTANAAWLIADRVIGLAASVVVTIMVVRYLGPANYGLLTYALALVGILAPFVQLGLDSIAVRDMVNDRESSAEIMGTAFVLMLASAVILVPAAIGAAVAFGNGDPRKYTIVGVLAVQYLFQALTIIDYWFRSGVRSKFVVWSSKAGLLANALLALVLIRQHSGTGMFALPTVLEAFVTACGLLFFYRRTGQHVSKWAFNARRAVALLRDGAPFLVGGVFGAISMKAAFIILEKIGPTRDVGLYGAAVRLSEMWYFVPMAIVVSIFPVIVHSRKSLSPESYDRRVQALYDVVALIGYGIALPTTLLARVLMPLIFGGAYAAAGPLLAIYIWMFLLVSIGIVRSTWLVAEGFGRHYMIATGGGAALNVALTYLLIPRFGVTGAAWATIAAHLWVVLFSSLVARATWRSFRHVALAFFIPLRWKAIAELRTLR